MKSKKTTLLLAVNPSDLATFKDWARAHEMTMTDFFRYLMRGVREERVYVLDRATAGTLLQGIRDSCVRMSRIEARREMRKLLAQEGFIATEFES